MQKKFKTFQWYRDDDANLDENGNKREDGSPPINDKITRLQREFEIFNQRRDRVREAFQRQQEFEYEFQEITSHSTFSPITSHSANPFEMLSDDITVGILSFLTLDDIQTTNIFGVCKKFNSLSNNEYLWKELCRRKWKYTGLDVYFREIPSLPKERSWKWLARCLRVNTKFSYLIKILLC